MFQSVEFPLVLPPCQSKEKPIPKMWITCKLGQCGDFNVLQKVQFRAKMINYATTDACWLESELHWPFEVNPYFCKPESSILSLPQHLKKIQTTLNPNLCFRAMEKVFKSEEEVGDWTMINLYQYGRLQSLGEAADHRTAVRGYPEITLVQFW